MASGILALGLIYFLAHGFTAMFARTRVPDVLFLIALGLLFGPVFHLISPADFGKIGPVMTTLALLVILFDSGTRLRLPDLAASFRDTLALGVSSFVVTAVLAAGLAKALGWLDWLPALMLGTAVAGSSAAVVVPLVYQLKVGEPASTTLITESALTDVLCIVGLFAIMQAFGQGVVDPGRVLGALLAALLLASAIGVLGAIGWLTLLSAVRRYPNSLSTTLGFALVLYGVAEILGYSGPIAVLAFGIALANQKELRITRLAFVHGRETDITEHERAFHAELVFIFKIFFFVYLGLSITFAPLLLGLAALITLAAYLGRLLLTRALLSRIAAWPDAAVVSFMVPKGLAAAVIAGIPLAAGVPGGETIRDTVYQVVLLSILLTAALVPATERTRLRNAYQWFFRGFRPSGAAQPAEPPATLA